MSFCVAKGLKAYYQQTGTGKQTVILLHGWGQNTEMMEPIQNHISKYFTVFSFDFPGFGKSDNLNEAWSADDYKGWLEEVVKELGITSPILIGHSFGGHIAMRYAVSNPVYKLVLLGASGLKPKRGLDYYFKTYAYKLSKQLFKIPQLSRYKEKYKGKFGSVDYQNTDGNLRLSFVKIVNSFVDDIVSGIKCPTLLVYGDQDEDTPLWMAEKLERLIPDAGLATFKGQGHYAYYIEANRMNLVLDAFFKEDVC